MHLRSHQSKPLIWQWPGTQGLRVKHGRVLSRRARWVRFTEYSARGRRQIALAGPRDEALLRQAHLQGVHFAVELRWREPERVLMMQLVGDAREGRREIGGGRQLEVAAAGRRRDLGQTLVGFVGLEAPSAAESATAKPTASAAASATPPASAASRSAPGSAREARGGAGEADGGQQH